MKMIKKTCIIKPIVVSFLFYLIILIALKLFKLNYKDFGQIYLFKVVFIGILIYLFYNLLCLVKIKSSYSFLILLIPNSIFWYYILTFRSELKTVDEIYIVTTFFSILHLIFYFFLKDHWFCKGN